MGPTSRGEEAGRGGQRSTFETTPWGHHRLKRDRDPTKTKKEREDPVTVG